MQRSLSLYVEKEAIFLDYPQQSLPSVIPQVTSYAPSMPQVTQETR